jgi:hypothetical protein
MNISGFGFSSIQTAINSGLENIAAETSQLGNAQPINAAIDSFQSIGVAGIQLNELKALPEISTPGSFADPLSFYAAQDQNSAVFQQLKNPSFQAAPNLQRLSKDLTNVSYSDGNLTFSEQLEAKKKELVELQKQIQKKEVIIHSKEAAAAELNAPQAQKADDGSIIDDIPVVKDIFGSDEPAQAPPHASPDLSEDYRQLNEMKAKEAELKKEIQTLEGQIDLIRQAPKQDVNELMQGGVNFQRAGAGFATAFDNTLTNFRGAIDLQLQFDAQKLFSQRFSPIRG